MPIAAFFALFLIERKSAKNPFEESNVDVVPLGGFCSNNDDIYRNFPPQLFTLMIKKCPIHGLISFQAGQQIALKGVWHEIFGFRFFFFIYLLFSYSCETECESFKYIFRAAKVSFQTLNLKEKVKDFPVIVYGKKCLLQMNCSSRKL